MDGSRSGRAAFSSAISTAIRASSPSRTAVSAAASSSMVRTRVAALDRSGLGGEPLGVGGGDDEGVGDLADRLGDEQVAQVGKQVAGELGRVATGARPSSRRSSSTASRVFGDHRVDRFEEQLRVGGAEQLQHRRRGRPCSPPKATSWSSVPSASRKLPEAERAIIATAPLLDLDPLGGGDPLQHLGDLLQRGALEVEALAAVGDRRHHLVRLGGGEDEDGVRRRLLERLEEGVPGLLGQHVGLVEDVDLPAAAGRRVGDPLAQVADVVDRAVGGGVHLDHVDRGAGGDRRGRTRIRRRG